MPNLNPIEKAKFIEDQFRKYIMSTYSFDNEVYQSQFHEKVQNTPLLRGPYISKTLEFQTKSTIEDLIKQGVVSSEFRKLGDVSLDRKLRTHQEKAIRLVHEGHSLIITTGTGSGKTESFLYPVINEILQEKNIDEPGVRAIFLFPMNALVNDQFDRVRRILNKYPKIKYGYFTGNTKEKVHNADDCRESIQSATDTEVNSNELLDREQIRKFPPHILFSNYSMLEYILLRPKDEALLNDLNIKKWKFIVLDEAHIYKGALGIEIGMLLRRLQQRIGHEVQFILTSATLGENDEKGIAKIIDFGQKLTSQKFNKEDVLFSDRIVLDARNARVKVSAEDYLELYKNLNQSAVSNLLNKYNILSDQLDLEGKLYDLISSDENLYRLDGILTKSMSVSDLFSEMMKYGFESIEQLSAFIDLICKCKKNNLKIMDLKYHSFIRSVAGAFVTLGEDPQLSLSQREYINGKKAFELGFCSQCNSMYLIGVERNGKLYQNHSVDIYENYDESDEIVLDYYILEDQLKNQDVDLSQLRKYQLCPICGTLIDDQLVNKDKLQCSHVDVQKIAIYKVEKDSSAVKNNLTSCPICNGRSNKGLIRTVSMGKESATALITQIFFEALEKDTIQEKPDVKKVTNPLLVRKVEQQSAKQYVKQILSFSDARQQASFSVKFAENNHHRLLRKRLIYKILSDACGAISFEQAAVMLDELIYKGDLFDTNNGDEELSSTKQAKITLLTEILNVDGIYGGEGLGLYYFDYQPISAMCQDLTTANVSEFLQQQHVEKSIDPDQFRSYLHVIINSFRNVPAVKYFDLSFDDRKKYFAYRMFDNHVKLVKNGNVFDSKGKDISRSVHGLISNNNKSNKIEAYTQAVFGVSKDKADEIIEAVWRGLTCFKGMLSSDDKKIYQIDANKFKLHLATDTKWYWCKKCRKLTRFNINNICPNCLQHNLQECNPDEYFKDNYYRYQYKNKKIEKLVYKEHTAQLSAEIAKERQLQFKRKEINFLSCSTTFEMGIDIGALENVLMRNVPPSPANYIQRAGRAGRAQDSSAFVLTYCSSSSHDYTFFENPLRMVDGICNTPVFTMENHKIIYRHLLAVALAGFFKENQHYFSSVKAFYLDGGFEEFEKYLESKDNELIEQTNYILSSTSAKELMNGKWIDNILREEDVDIYAFKENLQSTYKEIDEKLKEAFDLKDSQSIDYYNGQQSIILEDKDLIGKLSDGNLIPKYGFPTDLVELKIKGNDFKSGNYDLTRSMSIALSEYAPGSEIMVDKKIIVSTYINRPRKLKKMFYYECPHCHKTELKVVDSDAFTCSNCKTTEFVKPTGGFLTPKYGFTGIVKPNTSTELKPKRSYSSPIKYIGNGSLVGDVVKINDYLQFYVSKNDELLVVNENPFYYCPDCGYAEIDNNDSLKPYKVVKHNGIYSKCSNTKLLRQGLGYSYNTDVLKMVISLPMDGYNQAISTLYALLEGISLAFNIERNDIDGICIPENNGYVFVLFDTVPGGAGHVKRLLNKEEMIKAFNYALEKVSQECCDTACYNCLKNYKNQKYHEYLSRALATEMLLKLIGTLKASQHDHK